MLYTYSMNTQKIVELAGGRKAVIAMTGLTKGRISQWIVWKNIPKPWLLFFQEKFPDWDWKKLLSETPASKE